jgi:antitoxin ParD1/3/4
MRTTQQLSITLPNDLAAAVKAKVRTGEYATESEVIRDGLRALLARDRAVESWLHHQVSICGTLRPANRGAMRPAEVAV